MRYWMIAAALAATLATVGLRVVEAQDSKPQQLDVLRIETSSAGDCAVRSVSGGKWRLLDSGDVLPVDHEWRASANGVVRLESSRGRIALSPNSRGRLGSDQLSLTLEQGRIAVMSLANDKQWRVAGHGLTAEVGPQTEVEFEVKDSTTTPVMTGTVWQGTCVVRGATTTKNVSKGQLFQWDVAKSTLIVHELPESKQVSSRLLKPAAERFEFNLARDPDPGTGLIAKLHVARYHVNVVIEGTQVLVQLDHTFYSPFIRQSEGTFVFSLPDGAAVNRFAMYTAPDRLIEGELIPKDQARQIYDSIVTAQNDPAILEQLDDHNYRMRLFPIFPKETKRVLLDFTMSLADLPDNLQRLRLPLLNDATPIWDVQITGTIRGAVRAQSLKSPSHGRSSGWTVTSNDALSMTFQFQALDYQSDRDFIVQFHRDAEQAASLRLDPVSDDPDDGHFYLATLPAREIISKDQLQAAQTDSEIGVDVLLLADSSTSMTPWRAQQRRIIDSVLSNLRAQDRFRLAAIDIELRSANSQWNTPNATTRAAALQWLDQELFVGDSDFETTLSAAFELFPKAAGQRRQLLLYVGDGSRSNPPQGTKNLMDSLPQTDRALPRVAAIMLGTPQHSIGKIEGMVARQNGLLFQADAVGLRQSFQWLLAGLQMPLAIEFDQQSDPAKFEIDRPTNWDPETPLRVWGRVKNDDEVVVSGRVRYDGRMEATRFEHRFQVSDGIQDRFVGRACVQRLLKSIQREAQSTTVAAGRTFFDNEIAKLSRTWSVLSPQSAFLVLETNQEYRQRGLARAKRRPDWHPEGTLLADPVMGTVDVQASLDRQKANGRKQVAARLETQLANVRRSLADQNLRQADEQAFSLRWMKSPPQEVVDVLKQVDVQLKRRDLNAYARSQLREQRHFFLRDESKQASPLALNQDRSSKPIPEPLRERFFPAWADKVVQMPHLNDTPLIEVYRTLGQKLGIQFQLDLASLEASGIAPDTPISLRLSSPIRASSFLNLIHRELSLAWRQDGNIPVITTVDEAYRHLVTAVHPVGDLVDPTSPLMRDRLVLASLDHEQQQRTRLHAKLRQPARANFTETPLRDAIQFLSTQIGEPILISEQTLFNSRATPTTTVTLSGENAPAASLLDQILHPFQLTTVIANDVLQVAHFGDLPLIAEARFHSTRGLHLMPTLTRPRTAMPRAFGPSGIANNTGFGCGGGFGGGGGGLVGGVEPQNPAGAAPTATPVAQSPLFQNDNAIMPPAIQTQKRSATALDDEVFDSDHHQDIFRSNWTNNWDTNRVSTLLIDLTDGPWEPVGFAIAAASPLPMLDGLLVNHLPSGHDEIQRVLSDLRQAASTTEANTTATSVFDVTDSETNATLLISALTRTVGDWADDGWSNRMIKYDAPTRTLLVRNNFHTQRAIVKLLTQLRRARYQQLYGHEWQSSEARATGSLPLQELLHVDLSPQVPIPAHDPQRHQAALQDLSVRREVDLGRLTSWQSVRKQVVDKGSHRPIDRSPDGDVIAYLTQPKAIEFWTGQRFWRVEDERAARFDPVAQMVVIGPWGRAAQWQLNRQLPWLPHLSNAQIAKLFVVTRLGEDDQSVQLKLSVDEEVGEFAMSCDVRFSKQHGLPIEWNIYYLGQLNHRLRFEDLAETPETTEAKPTAKKIVQWRRVICEDATGKELERWELKDQRPAASLARAVAQSLAKTRKATGHAVPIPTHDWTSGKKRSWLVEQTAQSAEQPETIALRAGWADAIVLDLDRAVDGGRSHAEPFLRVMQLIQADDWQGVAQPLSVAQQRWPAHPLLRLLEAASLARPVSSSRSGSRETSELGEGVRTLTSSATGSATGTAPGSSNPSFDSDRAIEAAAQHRRVIALLSSVVRSHGVDLLDRMLVPERTAPNNAFPPVAVVSLSLTHAGDFPLNAEFFGLTNGELYDLFARQPEAQRQQADHLRLLDLACLAGRYDDALQHAAAAERANENRAAGSKAQRLPPEWYALKAHALRQSDRNAELLQHGEAALTEATLEAETLLALASELHRDAQFKQRDQLVDAAFKRVPETGQRRADLFWQAAEFETDLPRWQRLVLALENSAGNFPFQQTVWGQLKGELREGAEHADILKLIDGTTHKPLQRQLRQVAAINQFELGEPVAAFEYLWKLWESQELSQSDEVWLFELCVQHKRPDRMLQLIKTELQRPYATPQRFLLTTATRGIQDWKIDGTKLRQRIQSAINDLRSDVVPKNWHRFPAVRNQGGGAGFF